MNSVYLQLVFLPRLILFRCQVKNIGWSEEINAVGVSALGLMRSCGAEPGEGCSFVWVPSPLNSNKENSWSSIRVCVWGGVERRRTLRGGNTTKLIRLTNLRRN